MLSCACRFRLLPFLDGARWTALVQSHPLRGRQQHQERKSSRLPLQRPLAGLWAFGADLSVMLTGCHGSVCVLARMGAVMRGVVPCAAVAAQKLLPSEPRANVMPQQDSNNTILWLVQAGILLVECGCMEMRAPDMDWSVRQPALTVQLEG